MIISYRLNSILHKILSYMGIRPGIPIKSMNHHSKRSGYISSHLVPISGQFGCPYTFLDTHINPVFLRPVGELAREVLAVLHY